MSRAAMDYLAAAQCQRHRSWETFQAQRSGRLVLLSSKAQPSYLTFRFAPDDVLLLGRESAGVPDAVAACVDAAVRIPLRAGLRSLNVAVAAALVLGEALRQTDLFPKEAP